MGHMAEVGIGWDEGQLQILRRPPRRTPLDDKRICRWMTGVFVGAGQKSVVTNDLKLLFRSSFDRGRVHSQQARSRTTRGSDRPRQH